MLLINKKCPNCNTYYDPTLKECPTCHKSNELYQERSVCERIIFFDFRAQIGLFLAGFALTGMLLAELFVSLFIPDSIDLILKKTILISIAYLMMLLGLLAIVLTTRRKEFFSKYKRPFDYAFGVVYAIGVVVTGLLLSSFISIFHTAEDNANQESAVLMAKNYPIIALFILGFIGPICEELTYRVGLYSFLRRINKYLAFIVTVIVFASIHFDFEAIGSPQIVEELWALPSYIISGFILTLAYEHRGPACSMTAHVLYNLFAFMMMLLRIKNGQ